MAVADDERRALSDLFDETGPDAPTLCAGWLTRDLAAHIVTRERRPDAAAGIVVKPLAFYTRRVQDRYAARPWTQLVELVRSGPPRWSPMAIGAVNETVNTIEFFIHHEDVRRAGPEWEPRPPDAERDAAVWLSLSRAGRMLLRRSPVGVVLRRSDGREVTVKQGPNTVTISGEPAELLLFAFGRDAVRVDFDGEQSAIGAVQGVTRGL